MTVFYFFIVVMLANGELYYDDWAYTSKQDCEQQHEKIEEIVNKGMDRHEFLASHINQCMKIALGTRG